MPISRSSRWCPLCGGLGTQNEGPTEVIRGIEFATFTCTSCRCAFGDTLPPQTRAPERVAELLENLLVPPIKAGVEAVKTADAIIREQAKEIARLKQELAFLEQEAAAYKLSEFFGLVWPNIISTKKCVCGHEGIYHDSKGECQTRGLKNTILGPRWWRTCLCYEFSINPGVPSNEEDQGSS